LITMNGPVTRGLRLWISRAMSSLPVPVSPEISTEMSVGATFCTLRLHVQHRRHRADDLAELLPLRRFSSSALSVRRESSSKRVLQNQRGLPGEDRDEVQRARIEEARDAESLPRYSSPSRSPPR